MIELLSAHHRQADLSHTLAFVVVTCWWYMECFYNIVNEHDATILSCTNQYFVITMDWWTWVKSLEKTAVIICGPSVLQRLPLLFCTSSARLHKWEQVRQRWKTNQEDSRVKSSCNMKWKYWKVIEPSHTQFPQLHTVIWQSLSSLVWLYGRPKKQRLSLTSVIIELTFIERAQTRLHINDSVALYLLDV